MNIQNTSGTYLLSFALDLWRYLKKKWKKIRPSLNHLPKKNEKFGGYYEKHVIGESNFLYSDDVKRPLLPRALIRRGLEKNIRAINLKQTSKKY